MLPVYKNKITIAGKACIASVLVIIIPLLVTPEFWNNHPLVNAIFALAFTGSFYYICWAAAKGKGYAGWIGLILAIFSILGLAILIFLKDRHKGESSEDAKVLPPNPSGPLIQSSSFVVDADEQKSPVKDRIAQIVEKLRRKGQKTVGQLNGWQRIGLVLSVLWVCFVCGYSAYEYVQGGSGTRYLIEMVRTDNMPFSNPPSFEDFVQKPRLNVGLLIVAIIGPLAFVWAMADLVVVAVRWVLVIVRWIVAGFRKKNG